MASALRFQCECHSMTQVRRTFSLGLKHNLCRARKNVAKSKILQSQLRNLCTFLPLSIPRSVTTIGISHSKDIWRHWVEGCKSFVFFAEFYSSCKMRHCTSVQHELWFSCAKLALTHEDLKIHEFYTRANPSLDEFLALKTKNHQNWFYSNFSKNNMQFRKTQKVFVETKKKPRKCAKMRLQLVKMRENVDP